MNTQSTTFYLFRHGETDWNSKGLVQGHSNIPLNDKGRGQAAELTKKLKELDLEIIFSSDLDRAHETAMIAKGNLDLEIEKTDQLREAFFGEAEGLTFDEVKERWGEIIHKFRFYKAEYGDISFPGGESRGASIERMKAFIYKVKDSGKYSRVGISTHGGVIRNLLQSFQNTDNPEAIQIPNCVLYEVTICGGEISVQGPL